MADLLKLAVNGQISPGAPTPPVQAQPMTQDDPRISALIKQGFSPDEPVNQTVTDEPTGGELMRRRIFNAIGDAFSNYGHGINPNVAPGTGTDELFDQITRARAERAAVAAHQSHQKGEMGRESAQFQLSRILSQSDASDAEKRQIERELRNHGFQMELAKTAEGARHADSMAEIASRESIAKGENKSREDIAAMTSETRKDVAAMNSKADKKAKADQDKQLRKDAAALKSQMLGEIPNLPKLFETMSPDEIRAHIDATIGSYGFDDPESKEYRSNIQEFIDKYVEPKLKAEEERRVKAATTEGQAVEHRKAVEKKFEEEGKRLPGRMFGSG